MTVCYIYNFFYIGMQMMSGLKVLALTHAPLSMLAMGAKLDFALPEANHVS